MYKYELYRVLHKQRRVKSQTALIRTICNKGEFLFAGFLEMLFIVVPLITFIYFYVFKWNIEGFGLHILMYVIIIIYILIYMIGYIFVFKAQPLSYRILGLRTVELSRYKIVDGDRYLELFFTRAWESWKLNDDYEMLSTLFSETNQSPVMKKMGLIVVKLKIYNMFLEDYSENGKIIKSEKEISEEEKPESKILTVSHEQIFKD